MMILHAIAAAAALVLSAGASAADYPQKPIRMVVAYPAGGSTDMIARLYAEKLGQELKQSVVVDNRPGAATNIGADAVAKARPDGYTLGVGFNGPIAFGPFMYKKMSYDPARDLLPVVLTTSQPNVLAVPANNPANNITEFVAWARKQGDKLSYASVGAGSSSHLTMELLKSTAGIEAVHVPYAGSPPAVNALVSGEVQALFTVQPALLPLVQAGRIKLIGATSAQRAEGMKSLPTVAESGYPGFESLTWNGIFAPAGTAPETAARINADVNAVLADAAVAETFARQGLHAGGGTSAEFRSLIERETRKWGAIIKKVGITID